MVPYIYLNDIRNDRSDTNPHCTQFQLTQELLQALQKEQSKGFSSVLIPSLNDISDEYACSPIDVISCFDQIRQEGFNYELVNANSPIRCWKE